MPATIMPGSYTALYGQQLQKSILIMASQKATSPAAALAPTTGAAPQAANPLVMAQMDATIGNSISGMDSLLASVGVGISGSGLDTPPLASTPGIQSLAALSPGLGAAATPQPFSTPSTVNRATDTGTGLGGMSLPQLVATLFTLLAKLSPTTPKGTGGSSPSLDVQRTPTVFGGHSFSSFA